MSKLGFYSKKVDSKVEFEIVDTMLVSGSATWLNGDTWLAGPGEWCQSPWANTGISVPHIKTDALI